MAAPYKPTRQELADAFNDPGFLTSAGGDGLDNGTVWLVDDPANSGRGTVLRLDMFKDMWGHGQSDLVEPQPMGMQTNVRWDDGQGNTDRDFTEIYYAMDMYFPPGFIFPVSIHAWSMKNMLKVDEVQLPRNLTGLYRLFTANLGQVGAVLDLRVPANGDHSMGCYYYNAVKVQRTKRFTDQPTLAPENAKADAIYTQFIRGEWLRMEAHFKLNTFTGDTDNEDGVMEAWVNGEPVLKLTPGTGNPFPWRNSDFKDYTFDRSIFGNWVGGDSQLFAAAQDQSMYYDNLVVSTSPITHTP